MPYNFSFIIPNKLAGMGRPGAVSPLAGELLQLQRENIGALVSLTEDALDRAELKSAKMAYLHLPIVDYSTPTLAQIDELVEFVQTQNANGKAVCVHCAAGIGRTGTMLACYLVALGETAEQAINSVRAIRVGSIETKAQEQCIHDYETRRQKK